MHHLEQAMTRTCVTDCGSVPFRPHLRFERSVRIPSKCYL